MNYAQIRQFDVANGTGIRSSLFVSGCHFECKNCFNPEYWPFDYGNEYTDEVMNKFVKMGLNESVEGYSILGGEPLDQLADDMLLKTVKLIKEKSNKTIWMWTGFTLETMNEKQKEIIQYVDVLIDGQFIDAKKDLTLLFRGSSNQRLLDVQKSLKKGEAVPWDNNWKLK